MESHFEINVSLNGKHFFATAPRSLLDKGKALLLRDVFRNKFPADKGFVVSLTYWESIGHTVE